MRLHEAIKNFNVGLETVAQFLASKGIPLESKDVNSRIRDIQATALSREFGYKPASSPRVMPKSKTEETPEVKRLLAEIKSKKSTKKEKKEKKEKKAKERDNAAKEIIGKEVVVKVKSFQKNTLITKGYQTVFTEGRVSLDDVYYKGVKLSEYWAKFCLSACTGKMKFEVLDPAVGIDGTKATYAHLKYNVIPKDDWQNAFNSIKQKQEFKGKVIAINGEEYIVKCVLQNGFFLIGTVNVNDYIDEYEVNNSILVKLARKGRYLFDPVVFISSIEEKDDTVSVAPTVIETKKEVASKTVTGFEQWRNKQKLDIEEFYGSSSKTEEIIKQPVANDVNDRVPLEPLKSQKKIIEYSCEAYFFPEYEILGMTLKDFMFKKNDTFVSNIKKTNGLLVRYQLLLAVAQLIGEYHRQHLILKNIEPENFTINSVSPIRVKLVDDSLVDYKTSMMNTEPSSQWDAPEVQNHLSPYTPMSECYSFALQTLWVLTGQMEQISSDANPFLSASIVKLLEASLVTDPMKRPTFDKWIEALRLSLDEFVFCPNCKEWHPRTKELRCPFCHRHSLFDLRLSIGTIGVDSIYDEKSNTFHKDKTILGKCKYDIAINETSSKILYAYHFGLRNNPEQPVAVITMTACNDNNEVSLCVIPMLNTTITQVDQKFQPIGIQFKEQQNIDLDKDLISSTMLLVENNLFNNKVIQLCHI